LIAISSVPTTNVSFVVKLTFELLMAPEYVTLWNELVTDDEIASSTYFFVTNVKSSKFVNPDGCDVNLMLSETVKPVT
jgi:hypothetical protein